MRALFRPGLELDHVALGIGHVHPGHLRSGRRRQRDDFADGAAAAGPYLTLEQAKEAGAVTLNYGRFVNAIVSFLIVAIATFGLVRLTTRLHPPPTAEVATRECPECLTVIPKRAHRCAACTAQVTPVA